MAIISKRAVSAGAISAALNGSGTPLTLINAALTRPTEPTVTAVGGSGGANYRYVIVAHGAGTTAASAAMVNPVSGPAPGSLDASHYLSMTPPAGAGITLYDIYRTSSNAPLTPGYIGSVAPGVEFRDTGIVATDDASAGASDTGSAGLVVAGPVVAVRSTESNFGHFQAGPYPHVPVLGDTPGVNGYMGGMTTKDASNNGFVLTGNGDSAFSFIFRANANALPLRPAGSSGGQGQFSYESYVAGSELAWRTVARTESGLIGGAITAMTSNIGKHQWGVAEGGTYAATSIGMKLSGTNSGWAPALLFTNGLNLDMFNSGFLHPESNSSPTDYEVSRGKWNSNVFEFGPVAGGTGTKRAMNLTGAQVGFSLNSNGQLANVQTLTELTTIAAAATTDTSIQIPAGALVLAVSVRVTTVIPTATAFDYGIAGATTRYGTAISAAATTTAAGTNDGVRYYAGATAIRITPDVQPGDNTGRVRVTIHYITITPPTS